MVNKKGGETQALPKQAQNLNGLPNILKREINTLKRISPLTEPIYNKLNKLYAAKFPKKCNCCGTIYETREQYLQATRSLNRTATIFERNKVQEYRDCTCGSTLTLVTDDRRDNSEFGKERRRLFELCVEKLQKAQPQEHKKIEQVIRTEFQQIINAI